jgi:hypothetical protein
MLQAFMADRESCCTLSTLWVSLAVFSKPSMACRSLRIEGRISEAQSTIEAKSKPSVNLFILLTFLHDK